MPKANINLSLMSHVPSLGGGMWDNPESFKILIRYLKGDGF